MIDYPKIGTPILLGLLAVACLMIVISPLWPERPTPWQTVIHGVLIGAAIWLFIMAAIALVNLIAYDAARRMADINRARALTERVRLVETVSRMTPEQLAFIGKAQKSTLEFMIGWEGDIVDMLPMVLRTQWGDVPVDFIRLFLDQSIDGYTPPIRTWGDGTKERGYAEALVALFTSYGWLSPAMGNRSAEWLNYDAACNLLERMGI